MIDEACADVFGSVQKKFGEFVFVQVGACESSECVDEFQSR